MSTATLCRPDHRNGFELGNDSTIHYAFCGVWAAGLAARELVLTSSWFNAVNGFIVQDGPSAYVPANAKRICSVLGGKGDFNGDGV